jgi:hypothetical protein
MRRFRTRPGRPRRCTPRRHTPPGSARGRYRGSPPPRGRRVLAAHAGTSWAGGKLSQAFRKASTARSLAVTEYSLRSRSSPYGFHGTAVAPAWASVARRMADGRRTARPAVGSHRLPRSLPVRRRDAHARQLPVALCERAEDERDHHDRAWAERSLYMNTRADRAWQGEHAYSHDDGGV